MRYERGLRRRAIARRLILSWVIVAVTFFLIGLAVGVMIADAATIKEVICI